MAVAPMIGGRFVTNEAGAGQMVEQPLRLRSAHDLVVVDVLGADRLCRPCRGAQECWGKPAFTFGRN
jgi:hypothetical protein